MQDQPPPKYKSAFLSVVGSLTTLPAQTLFYGSALLAIAIQGGVESIPSDLVTIGTTLGVNALSSILERVAKGEDVSGDEIRKIVLDAIESAGVENLVTSNEFQRVVAHTFRQFDLLNYAIKEGEHNIANILGKQFEKYDVIFLEFKDDLTLIREQITDINISLQNLSAQVAEPQFPVEFVDEKIQADLERLQQHRFFAEFNRETFSIKFAEKLFGGVFSRGTHHLRSQSLAWCARILSVTNHLDKSKQYLSEAKKLGDNVDCEIADAFIASREGDKSKAISTLIKLASPAAYSAAFMILVHHDGIEAALQWLEIAKIDFASLDADGKYFLLAKLLEINELDVAHGYLDFLSDKDFDCQPLLYHWAGLIQLSQAIPVEFRLIALPKVPFEANNFPLDSSNDGLLVREKARKYFLEAIRVSSDLGFSRAASLSEEYVIWLELKDPKLAFGGRKKLENKLRGNNLDLCFVPLGLQFGIVLDIKKVEQEIQRQEALNGVSTYDTAIARLALAFVQATPEQAADYIASHIETLSQFITKKFVLLNQFGLLISANKVDAAGEILALLEAEGLTSAERKRIEVAMAEIEGGNSLEIRLALYEETKSITDLRILIDELATRNNWREVAKYCHALFETTNDLKDAERLIDALNRSHQSRKIILVLEKNSDLMLQSTSLQMIYCWALFYEGKFVKAELEMKKLSGLQGDQSYRALQVNLALSSGNWSSLISLIAEVSQDKEEKDALELLEMAQLACYLDVPTAKGLLQVSAQKGVGDPQILAQAYFLALSLGWEDEDTHKWMQEAASLSDRDGPIQKVSMRELADQIPDWNRQESKTWEQFRLGEIPMIVVDQSLRKSLVELMLLSAYRNLRENDPRKRRIIPSYSGQPRPSTSSIPKSIGLDVTALFTFEFLGLLETILQYFDEIYIPHSTLRWLFDEKQKIAFHQPKRVEDARLIRDLLATDVLHVIETSSVADSELKDQVGNELAGLIAEAAQLDGDNEVQKLVVRSSPVHRISSFMSEEADLTEHYQYLVSCQSVVNKLKSQGKITLKEETRALVYLQLQENAWPQEPEIVGNANLYLDDVTVSYFLHLEMLEKLKEAGFTTFISERKKAEVDALISYEKDSESVKNIIENIRAVLNSSIQSGKVRVDRFFRFEGNEADRFSDLPSMSLTALAERVDAIIVDDRVFNQHGYFENPQSKALIFSTLDILSALALEKVISHDDCLDHRMTLRRAGYFFIPVEDEELLFRLMNSEIKDGKLIETLGLRAIRENILHIRMSGWLQAPKEMPWVDNVLRCFIRVLHSLWSTDMALDEIKIRSEWLLEQLNFSVWTYLLGKDNGTDFIQIGRSAYLMMLLLPVDEMSVDHKQKYWAWIEPRVLAPLKEQYPDLYARIVKVLREQISRLANTNFANGSFDETQ